MFFVIVWCLELYLFINTIDIDMIILCIHSKWVLLSLCVCVCDKESGRMLGIRLQANHFSHKEFGGVCANRMSESKRQKENWKEMKKVPLNPLCTEFDFWWVLNKQKISNRLSAFGWHIILYYNLIIFNCVHSKEHSIKEKQRHFGREDENKIDTKRKNEWKSLAFV